jgi:hypothetical protein
MDKNGIEKLAKDPRHIPGIYACCDRSKRYSPILEPSSVPDSTQQIARIEPPYWRGACVEIGRRIVQ